MQLPETLPSISIKDNSNSSYSVTPPNATSFQAPQPKIQELRSKISKLHCCMAAKTTWQQEG